MSIHSKKKRRVVILMVYRLSNRIRNCDLINYFWYGPTYRRTTLVSCIDSLREFGDDRRTNKGAKVVYIVLYKYKGQSTLSYSPSMVSYSNSFPLHCTAALFKRIRIENIENKKRIGELC